MTTEQLHELRPGDRVLVKAAYGLDQPPQAVPPVEATFVTFAQEPENPRPWVIVCGIPDGWADEDNGVFGLRVLWPEQLLGRVTEDERIERLKERLRFMAKIAEQEPKPRSGRHRRGRPVASRSGASSAGSTPARSARGQG